MVALAGMLVAMVEPLTEFDAVKPARTEVGG